MNIDLDLKTQRQLAAIASNGTSSSSIYAFFERVLKQFDLKGDLLDFGAGKGYLTQRLQVMGSFESITAVDLMPCSEEIDQSIKWITWDLNCPTNIPDQTFDIIVSAEVIQHLENPRAVVREWFRLLRPGGTLIFSTPNNESWRALIALLIKGHYTDFSDTCYPAHITALLRKDIERILKEAGFSTPEFIFPNNGSLPKFTTISWHTISGGRLTGLRYSNNLIVASKKPIFLGKSVDKEDT